MTETLAGLAERETLVITEKELTYKTKKRHKVDLPRTAINSRDIAREFLQPLFEKSPVEILYAVALDARCNFLGFTKIAEGTVDKANIYPRNLLNFLLIEANASSVILAHNHPGGTARASAEDRKVTKEIKSLLSKIEVNLLDHLIYAPGMNEEKGTWISISV